MTSSRQGDSDTVGQLASLLGDANDWLRYAEAKNGALVAAALGLAIGCVTLLDWKQPLTSWGAPRWYLTFVLVELAGSAAVALVSFLPRTKIGRLLPKGEKTGADNLLYFGHIAKYSPKYLLEGIRELSGCVEGEPNALERRYAEQIVVNSRIATWKLRCATWSIRLMLSAIVTPAVTWALEAYFRRGEE